MRRHHAQILAATLKQTARSRQLSVNIASLTELYDMFTTAINVLHCDRAAVAASNTIQPIPRFHERRYTRISHGFCKLDLH
jgi:hypothetical protein